VVQPIDHVLPLETAHYLIEHPGNQVRRREVEQFRAWLQSAATAAADTPTHAIQHEESP
jgi:hypothetical protein